MCKPFSIYPDSRDSVFSNFPFTIHLLLAVAVYSPQPSERDNNINNKGFMLLCEITNLKAAKSGIL